MKAELKKHTKKNTIKLASKFKNKLQFFSKHPDEYNHAVKNNYFRELNFKSKVLHYGKYPGNKLPKNVNFMDLAKEFETTISKDMLRKLKFEIKERVEMRDRADETA